MAMFVGLRRNLQAAHDAAFLSAVQSLPSPAREKPGRVRPGSVRLSVVAKEPDLAMLEARMREKGTPVPERVRCANILGWFVTIREADPDGKPTRAIFRRNEDGRLIERIDTAQRR